MWSLSDDWQMLIAGEGGFCKAGADFIKSAKKDYMRWERNKDDPAWDEKMSRDRNAGMAALSTGLGVTLPSPILKNTTNATNLANVNTANTNATQSNLILVNSVGAQSAVLKGGWIQRNIYNTLEGALRNKFVVAIKKGFAPTREGSSGIIRLTKGEIIEHGGHVYNYKVKILGKGASHNRLYGRMDETELLFLII